MKRYGEIRVMTHDLCDQIRIGATFFSYDFEKAAKEAIAHFDKEMNWCGGFQVGAKKYYKRICLVDADTLKVVKILYQEDK